MLTVAERTQLHEFLSEKFSLEDLKDISLDVGIYWQDIPHVNRSSYARELIIYLEHRDKLGCLVTEINRRRSDDFIRRLLSNLPPCDSTHLIQIFLPQNFIENLPDYQERLADFFGVDRQQIQIVAAARGSMRTLIGVDKATINFQALLHRSQSMPWQTSFISIVLFAGLNRESQRTWRYIYQFAPFLREGRLLQATISWQEAVEKSNKLRFPKSNGEEFSHFDQTRNNTRDPDLSSEYSIGSSEHSGQASQTTSSETVPPPYSNMSSRQIPFAGHGIVDNRYRWYLVEQRQTDDFIPQIHSQDWLLVFMQPDQSDLAHTEEQPIVIVCQSDSESTIHLRPHPSEQVTHYPIYLRESRGESWSFERNQTTGEIFLTPEGREDVVDLEKIIGIVVGLWRPAKQMVD